MLLGDPRPIIPDDDEDILFRRAGEEMNFPSFRDRLNTVDNKIGYGQIDLTDIDLDHGQILLKVGIHPRILDLGIRPEEPHDGVQYFVQFNPFKGQGGKTIEIQKILQIIFQPEGLIADKIEKGLNLLFCAEMGLLLQFLSQEFNIDIEGTQGISNLMGHPSGQNPDGREVLAFADLPREQTLLRDIRKHGQAS